MTKNTVVVNSFFSSEINYKQGNHYRLIEYSRLTVLQSINEIPYIFSLRNKILKKIDVYARFSNQARLALLWCFLQISKVLQLY
jgi:hypothetical protein